VVKHGLSERDYIIEPETVTAMGEVVPVALPDLAIADQSA